MSGERCPRCNGQGNWTEGPPSHPVMPCPTCKGAGIVSVLSPDHTAPHPQETTK